jgi:hypothetical protein
MNTKSYLTVRLLSRTVLHIYTMRRRKMAKRIPIRLGVWR